jgi:hypothetical protein
LRRTSLIAKKEKFLGILAVSVLLSAPASAAVVLGGPETLSATPFTFGPSAADQFSLSYPSSGFFADTFVSTTGTADLRGDERAR